MNDAAMIAKIKNEAILIPSGRSKTLVTVVRYIEPNSDFHKLARFLETYSVREIGHI